MKVTLVFALEPTLIFGRFLITQNLFYIIFCFSLFNAVVVITYFLELLD